MWFARALRYGIRAALVTTIGGTLVGYLGYHTLYGRKGLVALETRERELSIALAQVEAQRAERQALEHRVRMLRRPVDADMLNEQAARVLNHLHPGQRVIYLDDLLPTQPMAPPPG